MLSQNKHEDLALSRIDVELISLTFLPMGNTSFVVFFDYNLRKKLALYEALVHKPSKK